MRAGPALIALCVSSTLCNACTKEIDTAESGFLYFGGNALRELDLSTGQTTVVQRWPDVRVDAVDIIQVEGHDAFVLSAYVLRPTDARAQIYLYDVNNGEQRPLFPGALAVSISSDIIAFYNRETNLSVAAVDGTPVSSVVVDTTRRQWLVPIVPISNTEFLYESSRSGSREVWKYDIETDHHVAMTEISFCSLETAVWRTRTSELLCQELEVDGSFGDGYILTDLDGEQSDAGEAGSGDFWPISYLDERDEVVLQAVRIDDAGEEQYSVWIYSFSTRELRLIAENLLVGKQATFSNERLTMR